MLVVEELHRNGSVLRRTSANMPRVRWLISVPVLCFIRFIIVHSLFGFVIVTADCWYDNEKHQEGSEVATAEPCLNCTCSRGVLLCYLRVCPKLPNPPPSGCILLHRYRACCPELICTDMPSGNGIESRSDPEVGMEFEMESLNLGNACVANGSIYGPGSAMDSSTDCEYCYCLGGQQRCVRPKCLLPLDGCTPAYASNDCCPVHYNCSSNLFTSTTTTTISTIEFESKGGCIVDSNFYPQGGKVLGVGHSICDNCYCLRGLVRCEPLSCAPPLLGCTPVIRQGECCAASYNCSGMIEAQPEPYYGLLPIVSKEYAKLRKEVQHKRTTTSYTSEPIKREAESNENTQNIPYYVIAETSKPKLQPTTRQYTGFITQSPFYYNITSQPSPSTIRKNNSLPEIYYVMTKVANGGRNSDDMDALATTVRHKKYTSSVLPPEVDTLENRINRRINQNDTDEISTTIEMSSTTTETNYILETTKGEEIISTPTTEEATTYFDETSTITTLLIEDITTTDSIEILETTEDVAFKRNASQNLFNQGQSDETQDQNNEAVKSLGYKNQTNTKQEQEIAEQSFIKDQLSEAISEDPIVDTTHEENPEQEPTEQYLSITLKTVSNTTDCSTTVNDFPGEKVTTELPATTTDDEDSTTIESTENIQEVIVADVNTATVVPKLVENRVNNVTKNKEDYDYDYNPPTLPPSLPNLRIIPFVAADALDSKQTQIKNKYAEDRNSEEYPFKNLFSPPAETEGGFVPKEPPLLDNFYENNYHTTNIGENAVTPIPGPAITNPPKTDENNCMVDGREVNHGESVPSEGTCAICVCFYGSIVCHEPQCPLPRTGCRNSSNIDRSTCCPHLICDDEESPTMYSDATSKPQDLITVSASMMTQDPFKDVIRTEPAPDLKLLIGDMSNYLLKQSTTPPTTTITQKEQETTNKTDALTDDDVLTLDKIWQFLISDDLSSRTTTKIPPTTTSATTVDSVSSNHLNLEIRTANHNMMETRENINDNLVRQPNDHSGVGLLKLAGCNIYGRMYRVGRIISELSGPCLECKCTEMGVQCETLKC